MARREASFSSNGFQILSGSLWPCNAASGTNGVHAGPVHLGIQLAADRSMESQMASTSRRRRTATAFGFPGPRLHTLHSSSWPFDSCCLSGSGDAVSSATNLPEQTNRRASRAARDEWAVRPSGQNRSECEPGPLQNGAAKHDSRSLAPSVDSQGSQSTGPGSSGADCSALEQGRRVAGL